jgi:tetratricopeptide (TPR) repeat protein
MRFIAIIFIFFGTFSSAQLMTEEMSNLHDELMSMPYEKKFKRLEKEIKKNPNEPWFYWMLADIYEMQNDDAKVVESYQKALAIDSSFDAAHASYSRYLRYMDTVDYELALYHVNKAISIQPDEFYYYIDRGNIYLGMKEFDQAILQANHVLKMEDADVMPAVQLIVQTMYDSGRMEDLQEYVMKHDLTQFNGFMDSEFDMLLGELYLVYNDKEKACKCFQFAAEPYRIFEGKMPESLEENLKMCM